MLSGDLKNIFVNLIVPGGILLGAVAVDLRTRKVPNEYVLSVFIFSLLFSVMNNGGISGTWTVLGSVLTAVIFTIPIYMLKAIGGGDLKLIIALSPLLSWEAVLVMIASSLLWGSVLGVFSAMTHGQFKNLGRNLVGILIAQEKPNTAQLHKIPFTVAILFGWVTQVTLQTYGVNLL